MQYFKKKLLPNCLLVLYFCRSKSRLFEPESDAGRTPGEPLAGMFASARLDQLLFRLNCRCARTLGGRRHWNVTMLHIGIWTVEAVFASWTLGFLVDEDLFNDFEKLYEVANEIGLQRKDVKIFTFIRVKKKLESVLPPVTLRLKSIQN